MALSVTPQASPLGANLIQETSSSSTVVANATGAAATLHMVDIDNAANGSAVYLKIYDNAAPTVGTTAADMVFRCAGSSRRVYALPTGELLANALSFATVTGAAESSTTSPGSAVIVRVLTS